MKMLSVLKLVTACSMGVAFICAQAAEIKWCRYNPTNKQISGFCYSSPAECEKVRDGYEACVQVTK